MKPEEGNQTRVSHDSMGIIENLLAFLLPHHLFFLKISSTDSGIPFFCFARSPNLSVDVAAGCTNHLSRLLTALRMSACHTGRNFLRSIKALSVGYFDVLLHEAIYSSVQITHMMVTRKTFWSLDGTGINACSEGNLDKL